MRHSDVLRGAMLFLVSLLVGGAVAPEALWAQRILDQSPLEGVYRHDRWGVARFGGSLVDPALDGTLAEFEGAPVSLEIKAARQPNRPGRAMITAVGAVKPLASWPLDLAVRFVPDAIDTKEPFQLIVELRNRTDEPLTVSNRNVFITLRFPIPVKDGAEPSLWFPPYTRGQLASKTRQAAVMSSTFIKTTSRDPGNLSEGSKIVIPPRDVFPLVVAFEEGLPGDVYELEVQVRLDDDAKAGRTARKWFELDVPRRGGEEPAESPLLVLERSVIEDDRFGYNYTFEVVVAPAEGERRRLVGFDNAEPAGWSGRVRALDKDGDEIDLSGDPPYHGSRGKWRLIDVPEDGIRLRGAFRKKSRFSTQSIATVLLDVHTDRGLETVVLAERFDDNPTVEMPPFGPEQQQGLKMRVRPVRESFRRGEMAQFHVQAVNVTGSPIAWWLPGGSGGEHVTMTVDGETLERPERKANVHYGWMGKADPGAVWEWRVSFRPDEDLDAGTHTFKYAITSPGGIGRDGVRLLKGTLTSNTVGFVIE